MSRVILAKPMSLPSSVWTASTTTLAKNSEPSLRTRQPSPAKRPSELAVSSACCGTLPNRRTWQAWLHCCRQALRLGRLRLRGHRLAETRLLPQSSPIALGGVGEIVPQADLVGEHEGVAHGDVGGGEAFGADKAAFQS